MFYIIIKGGSRLEVVWAIRRLPSHPVHPNADFFAGSLTHKEFVKVKVKVRIQAGSKAEADLVRLKLLTAHPNLIMAQPREGTNPKYEGRQKWAAYGDIIFDDDGGVPEKPRRRRTDQKGRPL